MKKLLLASLFLLSAVPFVTAQDADSDKPQTNVYAIVKAGDGRLQVIRAKEVEKKDPALLITDEEGRRASRQLNMLVDMLPFYVDEDQSLPDDSVNSILAQYDNLMKNYPELKKYLIVDRTKYNKIVEERKLLEEEKTKEKEAAVKKFTAEEFVDSDDLKLADMDAKIAAGEQIKTQYPDAALTIDTYLQPWLDRQAILKSGKVKYEGEWRAPQEIQKIYQERREVRMKSFMENIKPVAVSNTVASPSTMAIVAVFMSACALVALFCFYYAVFQSRIGGFLEFIMLIVSVLFMCVYAFYAVRIFNAPDTIVEEAAKPAAAAQAQPATTAAAPEGEAVAEAAPASPPAAENAVPTLDKLFKLIYIAQGETLRDLSAGDMNVSFSDTEINHAIDKLVQFRQDTTVGGLGVTMEKVRFHSFPAKLQFLQQTSCFGKNFLLRYDLHFQHSEGAILFYKCDVFIGETVLPAAIGNRLWLQFYRTMQDVLKSYNISRSYHIQKIEEGKITAGYTMPGTS